MLKPWAVLFRATCTQHSFIENAKYGKMALYWRKLGKLFFFFLRKCHCTGHDSYTGYVHFFLGSWEIHTYCDIVRVFFVAAITNNQNQTRVTALPEKALKWDPATTFTSFSHKNINTQKICPCCNNIWDSKKSIFFLFTFLNQHIWCIISLKHYNNRHSVALSLLWLAV